jgi:hypothetical protein
MPLVVSLMREFDAERLSFKQLRRALRAIEDYHFTYNVMASKRSSGGMSLFYGKRAPDLLQAGDEQKRARRMYARDRPKTALDLSRMTIEHLSLQAGESEHVGELGNLVLVNEGLKGKLANKAFADKVVLLKGAPEWVPQEVLDSVDWDDDAVERCTAALALEARDDVFRR